MQYKEEVLCKARTTETLYFDLNDCYWSNSKPDGFFREEWCYKRRGCIVHCYYAQQYLDDFENYKAEQIVAVFTDGRYIIFDDIQDALSSWLVLEVCDNA